MGVPLYILRHVKLPRKERRMILAIFASSAICSAPSTIYLIAASTSQELMCMFLLAYLKMPVILTVCNLLVVVTYIYARCWKKGDESLAVPSETTNMPESDSSGLFTDLGSMPFSSKGTVTTTGLETQIELYSTIGTFKSTEHQTERV